MARERDDSTQAIIVSLMLRDLIEDDGEKKHDGRGLLAKIRQCFLLKSIIATWARQQLVKLMTLDQIHHCREAQKHAKTMQDTHEDDEELKNKVKRIEEAIVKYLKAADADRETASKHIKTIVVEGKKHVDELRRMATDEFLAKLLKMHDIKLSDDLRQMLTDGAKSLNVHRILKRLTERNIPLPEGAETNPGLFAMIYQLATHLQGDVLSTAGATATPTPEDVLALDQAWEKRQEEMAGKIANMIQAADIEEVEERDKEIDEHADALGDLELETLLEKKNG